MVAATKSFVFRGLVCFSSLDVLNGFSVWPYAFLTDLKEPYRSIGTGDTTNNCRRFCWFRDKDDPSTLTDLMLNVSTYGDRSAGNLLSQGLDIAASHKDVSVDTADFIRRHFYVDDGGLSAATKEKLEKIISELPPSLLRYGFNVKHVLRSYEQSEGITNTEYEELLLGLIWDFVQDTLKPNTQIYLLCPEVLARTPVTMRTTLRAVGSLYDLSGKFLSPAQMKGRSLYS